MSVYFSQSHYQMEVLDFFLKPDPFPASLCCVTSPSSHRQPRHESRLLEPALFLLHTLSFKGSRSFQPSFVSHIPFFLSVPTACSMSVSEQITVMIPHLASLAPSYSPIFHAFEEDTFIIILQGQTSSPHFLSIHCRQLSIYMALKTLLINLLLPFAHGRSL